ncbi:MAG: S41 family peptidase [Bacteroidia bacterium]
MTRNLNIIFIKATVIVAFFSAGLITVNAQSYNQTKEAAKFNSFMDYLNYTYVDEVDQSDLTEKAIVSVLKELDPHSVYIPKEELKAMNEPLVGNFEGIGIEFQILHDTIQVTATVPGGPSEKIGIMAGDRIVKIEDETVAGTGITNRDVIKKLRGNKGTKVKVEMARRGSQGLQEFVITRDKIPLYSVDASYLAAPEIGYIKVNRFSDTTSEEFRKALDKVTALGAKNLILDLTGNGGGYMNRAIEMADEFLADDKLVVYTEGRANPRQEYKATRQGMFEKGKVVVLIDEGSASASEIVSGALQDWDRGLVIGRRSFGKGLVQKPIMLPDGSAIRLTTARYYTPSGRSIQKPYENGLEDYNQDMSNRLKKGELTSADSIHFPDSLKYLTSNKRVVFGGGGIMPDVFVPLDTSDVTAYYRQVQRSGLMSQFAVTHIDNNRNSFLKSYANAEAFKTTFEVDKALMEKFLAFAEKEDVKRSEADLAISSDLIKTQLKALMARNLWDLEAYYFIINDINPSFQKAVEAIKDKTFEEMKIVSN